jgi:hypothetical protein
LSLFLLIVVAVLAGLTVLRAGIRVERWFEYPTLVSAVYLGWVMPQNLLLVRDASVPEEATELLLVMEILCLLAIHAGWRSARRPADVVAHPWRSNRLFQGLVALTGLGLVFSYLIGTLPPELVGVTAWTGLPVAYLFFARASFYAAIVGWLAGLATGDRRFYMLAAIAAWPTVDAVFFAIRRSNAIALAFTVLGGLWLVRRWRPPGWLFAAGVVLGALFVGSAGDLRSISFEQSTEIGIVRKERSITDLTTIPFLENLLPEAVPYSYELKNAALTLAFVHERGAIDFGASFWNWLVFSYVPAQILGQDLKASLMFPMEEDRYGSFLYEATPGTTVSGFADSFQAFWLFGALVFMVYARMLRIIYGYALSGNSWYQAAYLFLAPEALVAITHNSSWLLSSAIHFMIFVVPLKRYAEAHPGRRESSAPSRSRIGGFVPGLGDGRRRLPQPPRGRTGQVPAGRP